MITAQTTANLSGIKCSATREKNRIELTPLLRQYVQTQGEKSFPEEVEIVEGSIFYWVPPYFDFMEKLFNSGGPLDEENRRFVTSYLIRYAEDPKSLYQFAALSVLLNGKNDPARYEALEIYRDIARDTQDPEKQQRAIEALKKYVNSLKKTAIRFRRISSHRIVNTVTLTSACCKEESCESIFPGDGVCLV